MQSRKKGELVMVRLFTGEDLFSELENACREHGLKTAVVLSGIGQLKEFKLGFFKEKGDYLPEYFNYTHELISLSGIISNNDGNYEFHLHAALGDEEKNVIGGHLIEGKVQVTNEIALLGSGMDSPRRINGKTGLKELFLD